MGEYSRRGFLSRLVAGAAAVTASSFLDLEGFENDPEKLLWVPGQKTFFLPPVEEFRSGADAIADFATIQQRPLKEVLKGAKHVQTRRGVLTFDAAWNIIGLNGRRLNTAEATQLRQESFAPWGGRWKDPDVAVTEQDITTQRAASGVTEPTRRETYFTFDPKTVSKYLPTDAPFRIVGDEKPPWAPGEEPWTARGRRKAGALKPHDTTGSGSRLIKSW